MNDEQAGYEDENWVIEEIERNQFVDYEDDSVLMEDARRNPIHPHQQTETKKNNEKELRLDRKIKWVKDNKEIEVFIGEKSISKDNFRIIPHNLFQAVYKGDFTKLEIKVMLYLIDLTIGFFHNTNDFPISIYKMSKEIGAGRHNTKETLERLIKRDILWQHYESVLKNGKKVYRYYFNSHFEFWKIRNPEFIEFIENEKREQPERIKRLKKRKQEIDAAKKKKIYKKRG